MAFEDVSVGEEELGSSGEFFNFKANGDELIGLFIAQAKSTSKFAAERGEDKCHRYTFMTPAGVVKILDPAPALVEMALDRAIKSGKLKHACKVKIKRTGVSQKPPAEGKSPAAIFKTEIDPEIKPGAAEYIKKKLAEAPAPKPAAPPPPAAAPADSDPFAD